MTGNIDLRPFTAIITDYDNTLVDGSHRIPTRVKNKITKLDRNGIIFTIATGRHYYGQIKKTVHSLKLSAPVITRGGAEIIDPKTNKIVFCSLIPKKTAGAIMQNLHNAKHTFTAEVDQTIYTSNYSSATAYPTGLTQKKYPPGLSTEISKIIVRPPKKDVENTIENLLSKHNDIHVTKALGSNGSIIVDITGQGATKHLAVLEFCKLTHIKPQKIIGVGDSYNDYPLLTACGYKVATTDAPQQLKQIADLVIPSAKKHGIITLLNHFV